MTAEQFAYWMQGFAELTGDEPPTPAQWRSMKEHLRTVFLKVTPPLQADRIDPSKVQPYPPTHPPYPSIMPSDWQRPRTSGDPRPLIATCISAPVAQTTC